MGYVLPFQSFLSHILRSCWHEDLTPYEYAVALLTMMRNGYKQACIECRFLIEMEGGGGFMIGGSVGWRTKGGRGGGGTKGMSIAQY